MDDLYVMIKERYRKNLDMISFNEKIPGYFEYIFKQGPLIRRYNTRFNFLKVPVFSRKVELNDEFFNRFKSFYFDYIVPIKPYLKGIIQKGWRWSFLSVRDYNLIVFFSNFCDKFEDATILKTINHKTFVLFEDLFIKISKDSEVVSSLILSLMTSLKNNKNIIY